MADGESSGEERMSETGEVPRPLKRWRLLVVGRSAAAMVEDAQSDDLGALTQGLRREGPLGSERPAAAEG
jgi:hypothetical protein